MKKILAGFIVILAGIALLAYYDQYLKPEQEALKILEQAKLMSEVSDKELLNKSYRMLTKVVSNYPKTVSAVEAYLYIGKIYEKMGLFRQANLKYSYILKNKQSLMTNKVKLEAVSRIAHIKILQDYSDEGVNQLLSVLGETHDRDNRSRIYSELGFSLLKARRLDKARHFFDLSLQENTHNEEAILGKARVLKLKGLSKQAYLQYEKFLKHFGNTSVYKGDVVKVFRRQVFQSGITCYHKSKYRDAVFYFMKVLKYNSGNKISEEALFWLGESYLALRNYKKSIKYYDKVLINEFKSKDERAMIRKGYAYFMMKSYDVAAGIFEDYLNSYSLGKYVKLAGKWKDICIREIEYKEEIVEKDNPIKEKRDVPKDKIDKKSESKLEKKLNNSYNNELKIVKDELNDMYKEESYDDEVSGKMESLKVKLEDVTEI